MIVHVIIKTVHYGHDLEKDLEINSEHFAILHENEGESTSRTMYYFEGMTVETFVDEYDKWIRGTIIRANDNSHSVEIELDPKYSDPSFNFQFSESLSILSATAPLLRPRQS